MLKSSAIVAAVAASLSVASAPAVAQQQNGLVNVNLGDVTVQLQNLLNNNQISIPATVQVPIGIAANVCGVTVAALVQRVKGGNNSCDARTANAALARIVSRQAQ